MDFVLLKKFCSLGSKLIQTLLIFHGLMVYIACEYFLLLSLYFCDAFSENTRCILSNYEEIEKLKLSVFREWLANELNIEVEKINPSSLNSALARHRNKLKKQGKNTAATKTVTRPEVQRTSFPFSKDDEPPQKQNIVEM